MKFEWKPDPDFKNGSVWDLYVDGIQTDVYVNSLKHVGVVLRTNNGRRMCETMHQAATHAQAQILLESAAAGYVIWG